MRIIMFGEAKGLVRTALGLKEAASRILGMEWQVACSGQGAITLRVQDTGLRPQAYRLVVRPSGIELTGQDPAGLAYAVATLIQCMNQSPSVMPAGEILDWPDYPVRGVMLDISRNKVPSMATLYSLVDLLAGLKVNHLQLYTEHTFAYTAHREVWAEASPMTAEEVLLLDSYCRERFVELAPNQNSFGHLQDWLRLPRYRELAECTGGFEWPWGGRSEEPFSLDPSNPGSLELLAGLYDELLPNFDSRLFNVGCDETFDLGQGRNRQLCERVGKGRVYLDFLLKIHRLVSERGRTMLYWGDIIMEHPELVPELPKDAIALEWGYEANHPFDEHGAKLRASGVPWWVCPGTSSWNSFAGRTDNCLANLRAAARAGLAHGATGFLNTDWGDNGHWQFLPVSYLGLAAGASVSWHNGGRETDFARELDAHVFRDRAGVMGGLARDLGNAYKRTGLQVHNESALFQVLRHPERAAPPEGLRPDALADTCTWIESAAGRLDAARMDLPDAALIRDEYGLTVRMMLLACEGAAVLGGFGAAVLGGFGAAVLGGFGAAVLGGSGAADRPAGRASRRESVRDIIGEFSRLWLARNRIGGLSDSVRRLEALIPFSAQAVG